MPRPKGQWARSEIMPQDSTNKAMWEELVPVILCVRRILENQNNIKTHVVGMRNYYGQNQVST